MDETKKKQLNEVIEGTITQLGPSLLMTVQALFTAYNIPITSTFPVAFTACVSLLNFRAYYNQQRLNNLLEFISHKNTVFTKDLLEDKDFQQGMIYFVDNYFTIRDEEKLRIAKNILVGFATSREKKEFTLEKFIRTLDLISAEGIEYIHFLKENIFEDWEENIRIDMDRLSCNREMVEENETITKYISKWIYENFNPNVPKVKKRWSYDESLDEKNELLGKIYDEERIHIYRMNEIAAEYSSLGLFRDSYMDLSYEKKYTFTNFGKNFFSFILE